MGIRNSFQSCVHGFLGKGEAAPGYGVLSETGEAASVEPMVSCWCDAKFVQRSLTKISTLLREVSQGV